jgi:sugar phosphate isomerase/epimerase
MQLGYRIIRPSDVGTQSVNFAQISLWRKADWGVSDGARGVREAIEMADACRALGIRTVYHPLEYPLTGELGPGTVEMMQRLAAASDLGIIIHDEGGENDGRLSGADAVQYGVNVRTLSRLCPVSIENSNNSGDITWFWERFVVPMPESVSITLDIGHLELAGIDSVEFVRAMSDLLVSRIRFVHIHHHDGGSAAFVKDHQPLVPGCREIEALRLLNERKKGLWVIVELDAAQDGMAASIALLEQEQARTGGHIG